HLIRRMTANDFGKVCGVGCRLGLSQNGVSVGAEFSLFFRGGICGHFEKDDRRMDGCWCCVAGFVTPVVLLDILFGDSRVWLREVRFPELGGNEILDALLNFRSLIETCCFSFSIKRVSLDKPLECMKFLGGGQVLLFVPMLARQFIPEHLNGDFLAGYRRD